MASLAKNTVLLTGASILQKAVAFIYFALIARMVGVESTGIYFLSLAMVTTVGVFGDFGLTSVLIRDVAREQHRAKEFLRRMLGVKLLVIPLATTMAIVLPRILEYGPESMFLILCAIPIMVADTLSLSFYGVLRGMQELRYESVGIFVGQSLTTIMGAVVLFGVGPSLPGLIAALVAGSTWNAFFSAFQIWRRLGAKAFIPSWEAMIPILRAAFPFFLAAVFVKIYSYVDSFTLKAVIGDSAVGLYSVAYKLTYAFQFLPLAFVGALYPKLASQSKDPGALKKTFLDAEWYLALLAAPIVFGIAALAPQIISLAYGSAYGESALPLVVLVFVLIPIFADFPVGSMLNSTGKQSTKTAIMGVTMLVNFSANFFLIPRFGVVGASLAGLLSFVTMFALGVFFVQRQLHLTVKEWFDAVGKFLIAGMCMGIVVFVLKSMVPPVAYVHGASIGWILTVPIGAIVFVSVAIGLGAITKAHWNHVRSLLKKPSYGTDPVANA
jgi:O-antigen/teichoic acid export membrane protein